jgi:membrane protein
VVNLKIYFTLFRQAMAAWSDDRAASMGAALAFYSAFSMAPLLLIAISVAGMVFGDDAARGAVLAQLRSLVGPSGAEAVQGLLQAASTMRSGVIATVVGLLALLVGATTVLVELQDDLDRIWKAPPRASGGIKTMIRVRLRSFGLILGIGFLLLVSLVAGSALAAARTFWSDNVPSGWLVLPLDFAVSIALFTALFAMLFKWLPRVRIRWRDVWTGAFTTAVLFNVGRLAIGLYLGQSATISAYAAAASLSVLLLWLYYSAQIFLFGAEFTWVHAQYRLNTQSQVVKAKP